MTVAPGGRNPMHGAPPRGVRSLVPGKAKLRACPPTCARWWFSCGRHEVKAASLAQIVANRKAPLPAVIVEELRCRERPAASVQPSWWRPIQAMLDNSGSKAITLQMVRTFAKTACQRIRLEGGGYRRDHLRAPSVSKRRMARFGSWIKGPADSGAYRKN